MNRLNMLLSCRKQSLLLVNVSCNVIQSAYIKRVMNLLWQWRHQETTGQWDSLFSK